MQIVNKYLLIFICVSALTLTSCGFKLRSAANLPPQLHTIYLESQSPYSLVTRMLRDNLHYSGIKLVEHADLAPITFCIISENLSASQASVGSQMRDYLTTYYVTYAVKNAKGKTLVGPKTVATQRTVTVLANEILENSNKLIEAKNSMINEIIEDIIFQLNSDETKKSLKNAKALASKIRPSVRAD